MNATAYAYGNREMQQDRAAEAWAYRESKIADWILSSSMDAVRDALPRDLREQLSALMIEIGDRLEDADLNGKGKHGDEVKAILESL